MPKTIETRNMYHNIQAEQICNPSLHLGMGVILFSFMSSSLFCLYIVIPIPCFYGFWHGASLHLHTFYGNVFYTCLYCSQLIQRVNSNTKKIILITCCSGGYYTLSSIFPHPMAQENTFTHSCVIYTHLLILPTSKCNKKHLL